MGGSERQEAEIRAAAGGCMTEDERREVAEAREFLDMLCRAYHEQVRRKKSGEEQFNRAGVLLLYSDVTYHRNRIIEIGTKAMDRGSDAPDALIAYDLVRTWKSLMNAISGTKHDYIPPKI